MKTRLIYLTFIGTVVVAQGQSQPAPAAAEGPGISQSGSNESVPANSPGPGKRGPQDRHRTGTGLHSRPTAQSGRFADDGAGPGAPPRDGMRPEGMRPEDGGREVAGGPGGPGFGGAPGFNFEQGTDPEEIGDPEGPDAAFEGRSEDGSGAVPGGQMDRPMDGERAFRDGRGFGGPGFGGPAFGGGGPAFARGPAGPSGPQPGMEEFGVMGPRPGEPFGPPPPDEALRSVLGLDDKQMQSLRQLQLVKFTQLEETQFQIHQKQGALVDMLEQEEPDGNAMVSAVKSIHALRRHLREIEKEYQEKTAGVLNEEQKTKLKSIQEARQIPQAMQEAARFNLDGPEGIPEQ